jgi:hypothetical protein
LKHLYLSSACIFLLIGQKVYLAYRPHIFIWLSRIFLRLLLSLTLLLSTTCIYAQQNEPLEVASASSSVTADSSANLPDAPDADMQQGQSNSSASETNKKPEAPRPAPQPKRILGLMPNYRAVSAGVTPPPPTPKEAFMIATRNSFDYSAFVFTGLTSLIAEGEDSHPELGKGVPGFWAYSWRGFLDKTDGNYWVVFALPTVFHEDERYYALGKGSILKRAVYAATRVAITPDYNGHNTINASELLGRGIAQGISTTYYPSQDRTASKLASKYAYAVLRDAATNTFREFWPDIAVHVLHRNP